MNARGLVALILEISFVAVALVGRMLLHRRRTGDWGIRWQRHDRVARISGASLVASIVVGLVGATLAASGSTGLIGVLDRPVVAVIGVVSYIAGVALTIAAQSAMGAAWRVGVDPDEATDLVVDGPFGMARNPIYTGMVIVAGGLALIAPTLLILTAVVLLIVAVELQVRAVEEPYLRATIPAWSIYAHDIGRFVPHVGRIRSRSAALRDRP